MQPGNANGDSLDWRGRGRRIAAGPALATAAICASLGMSVVALVHSDSGAPVPSSGVSTKAATSALDVKIMGSWKLGPDGKRHDAWTQTDFAVKVGKPLKLRINDADSSPHSLTSPEAGVNIIVLPGVHTYMLVVHKRGRFHWRCIMTCDTEAAGWAMTHSGYMSGYITAS
jgi:heme/copper-type cytochrome/quinol oxidase subunit 2